MTQLYKDTFDRFKNDNPDFSGAKIIFAPLRRVDTATMTKYLELASQLKVIHTDIACFMILLFIKGFFIALISQIFYEMSVI